MIYRLVCFAALTFVATLPRGAAASSALFHAVNSEGVSTGQTATAQFRFVDGQTLHIEFRETTESTFVTDAASLIATSIGFNPDLLPSGITPVVAGSQVVVADGSQTANFSVANGGPGFDVSGEYGVTTAAVQNGWFPGLWYWVSAHNPHVSPFVGPNRDGKTPLQGPQGGVSSSSDISSQGYIRNGVVIDLRLSDFLTGPQQEAFLAGVSATGGSFVEWGSDAAFAASNPEPSALVLAAIGGAGLLIAGRRKRKKRRAA
jgi:hypothetical protein